MPTVALYGTSLVLAAVGARVERRMGWHPVTIDAALPGAFDKLSTLQPDVIVLDLAAGQPDPVMALWKTRPEVLLIGIDLGADRMLVLSGQPAHALSVEDLIDTLRTQTRGEMK